MAGRRIRITPQPFDIDLDEVDADGMGTKLIVNAVDNPALPLEQAGDINTVLETVFPLPPADPFDGTDPRSLGAGIFLQAIVKDRLPEDLATAPNLQIAKLLDLTEIWTYEVQVEEVQDQPQTRYSYTTERVGANGRYNFTDELINDSIAAFNLEFDFKDYTAERVSASATTILYRFRELPNRPIPTPEERAEVSEWMRRWLDQQVLESRRYSFSEAGIAALQAGTDDPGILIGTWDEIAPLIDDGLSR